MAWGNAVLSENQNDVDAYLAGRGYEAERDVYKRQFWENVAWNSGRLRQV